MGIYVQEHVKEYAYNMPLKNLQIWGGMLQGKKDVKSVKYSLQIKELGMNKAFGANVVIIK